MTHRGLFSVFASVRRASERAARHLAVAALAAAALLTACAGNEAGGADFTVDSLTTPGQGLHSSFDSGTYAFDGVNHITAVLLQGSVEHPTLAVTIRMFWAPAAGKTPLEKTSTNATINYVIFTGDKDGEVGVYSGAGFVHPSGDAGDPTLTFALKEAQLRLSDCSDRFSDLLGSALAAGSFTVRLDDLTTRENLHKLNVLVSQRLTYPRLVQGNGADEPHPPLDTRLAARD